MKICKVGCHLDCRKHFFSNRVVNLRNKLPGDIPACDTVEKFKAQLDKSISQGFIKVIDFRPLCYHVFIMW